MKKKLTALLTACLVMLSVFPTNIAAATTDPKTVITANCTVPDITIDVTVPSQVQSIVNPHELQVNAGGKQMYGQIIFTSSAYIENKSEVPISVSASITGKINDGSTMTLNTKSATRLKTKAAFVYFEMLAVDDPENVTWSTSYNKRSHLLVLDGITQSKENIVTLGAASQENHFGAFQLNGDCVEFPKGDSWTDGDGFTATIVFTFKALPLT